LGNPGRGERLDRRNCALRVAGDYFTTYPDKVRALTVNDLVKAAEKVVHPDQLVWLVVGDRAKIETGIQELGWGEVQLLNADGEPAQ
jgi:zinc protease